MLKVNPLSVPSGGSLDDFPAGANSFRLGTYLQRSAELTGNTNTKVGTLSFWIKRGSWNGTEYIHEFPGGWHPCWIASDNKIYFATHDTGGSVTPCYISTNAIPLDGLWHHIVFAFSLAAGNNQTMAFVDGINRTATVTAASNTTVAWTGRGDFIVGARYAATDYLLSSIAEYYLNTKEFVDVRVAANMAKFRNAAGKPVNLGPAGEWVTGNKPIVYFRRNAGGPVSDFRKNLGTGGNVNANGFTLSGSLLDEPIAPSSFWKPVWGSGIYDSSTGWAGYTLRFFIYPRSVYADSIGAPPPGQTQVRVTVSGDTASPGSTATWDKMYIGHADYPANAVAARDLTQLFFNGAAGGTVQGQSSRTSDPANWVYDGVSGILCTVHFTSAGQIARSLNPYPYTYYSTGDYAALLDTSGYSNTSQGYCYFFNGIEMN